jgi:AcrR family transcriptional regulator
VPANLEAVARTRTKIHSAAIRLFTTGGFHGTGIRDIARVAEVSLGNLYNHHKNKEELFRAIMEGLEKDYLSEGTPLDLAFDSFGSIEHLEELGQSCGEMVDEFRDYIKLIYVDAVELSGGHICKVYRTLRERYEMKLGDKLRAMQSEGKLAAGDPIAAMMVTTITFFFYFNITRVFGVGQFFSPTDKGAIAAISAVLRDGMRPR